MIHIHITIMLAFLVFALHFGAHAIPITTTTDLNIPGSTGSPSLPPSSAPTLYPPPAANPPGANPTSANPPSANPPSANPPSANPPSANPPGANPPGTNPPGANPPGANPGNDGDSPGPTYQDAPHPSLTANPAIPASTLTVITTIRETEFAGTMFINVTVTIPQPSFVAANSPSSNTKPMSKAWKIAIPVISLVGVAALSWFWFRGRSEYSRTATNEKDPKPSKDETSDDGHSLTGGTTSIETTKGASGVGS